MTIKQFDHRGYKGVRLLMDNYRKTFRVHRLVAMAFIPNPNNLPMVLHLDNNRSNSNVSNLKWGTHFDNMQQAKNEKRMNSKGNLVIDMETGIFYNSFKEAAISNSITPKTLSKRPPHNNRFIVLQLKRSTFSLSKQLEV